MLDLKKYAELLVDYCLYLKKGDKLYIRTTLLAEPLVREVYRFALRRGAHVEYSLSFRESGKIFFEEASEEQLDFEDLLYNEAMATYDAFLAIKAPYNLMANQQIDKTKQARRSKAMSKGQSNYFKRTGDGSMRRSLCLFPTMASAQMAEMSLEDYEQFVSKACRLDQDNPAAAWKKLGIFQQRIVDYLNQVDKVQYQAPSVDISFSVKGRKWINSDGKTNMPSGEVFTGPIEDSVQGKIHFNYPSVFKSKVVQGIDLEIKDGKVINGHAERGNDVLQEVLKIKGANYFGEVAIGTNEQIQQATKNILFDEKIGGTIHMALGQSYYQTGATNQSSIHWDMITDMSQGRILADGVMIYENGKFLI